MAISPRLVRDGRPATTKRKAGSDLQTSWASSPQSRTRMQAQRARDTAPELAIRRLLYQVGFRYRIDRSPIPSLHRRADIVFGAARVAVFVDGCFWHSCPQHGTKPKSNADRWEAKLSRNRIRDRHTDQVLLDSGWLPVRVWEHEEPTVAASKIATIVRARTAAASPRSRRADQLYSRSISPISPRSESSSLALSDATR